MMVAHVLEENASEVELREWLSQWPHIQKEYDNFSIKLQRR